MKRYILAIVFFIVFMAVIGVRHSQNIKDEVKEIQEVSLLLRYEATEGEKVSVSRSNTYFVTLKDGNIHYYDKGYVQWNKKISENLIGIQISDNGDRIATWESNKIYFLDKHGNKLWSIDLNGNLTSIVISPDSSYLISVLEDKLQFISTSIITMNRIFEERDVGSVEKIFISEDSSSVGVLASVHAPQYLNEGQFLGTMVSSKIYLFDKNGKLKWQKNMPNEYITSISVSNKGKYVAAATSHLLSAFDTEKPLYVFDENGELIWRFNALNGFFDIVISQDNNYVAAGSRDGNVYFFDKKGNLIWKTAGGDYLVTISENYIATVSSANLYLFDKNGNLLWEHEATKELPVKFPKSLSISQDENYLLFSAYKGAPGEPEEVYIFKMQLASEPFLTPIAPSQQTYTSEGRISASSKPVIESISPFTGSIGTEVIIRGSRFTDTNNDIGFRYKDINFQGENTAYLNHVSSPDGKTLRFIVPELLGACPLSQLGLNETCPAVGIRLPLGDVQIFAVNKNGVSNNVTFTVIS